VSGRPPRTLAISPTEDEAPVLDAWLEALRDSGVEAVQIRRKATGDELVVAVVRRARELLDPGVQLLVNGRADIAVTVGADGVHLPSAGVPVAVARHCLGAGALVGRSTHTIAEIESAAAEQVDYVTFGPVFHTPSKARFGPPVGLEALAAACSLGVPVLALGGITRIGRVRECLAAGAWGIAGIRLFAAAGLDLSKFPEA
jgi:thiamine-phosphate pyrophosphorylase